MSPRDVTRLLGVHPRLVTIMHAVLAAMEAADHPMFVIEGLRSTERQRSLYAIGRTSPGTLVTYKDGITHRSNHQTHADGLGYAVDCAFIDKEPFSLVHPWETYGEQLELAGAKWGGRWRMNDLEHAELPDEPTQLKKV